MNPTKIRTTMAVKTHLCCLTLSMLLAACGGAGTDPNSGNLSGVTILAAASQARSTPLATVGAANDLESVANLQNLTPATAVSDGVSPGTSTWITAMEMAADQPMAAAPLPADVASLAQHCATPRPSGTIDPVTRQPYGDVQGSLTTEMQWITAFVHDTYLWNNDVPIVSMAPYVPGATVPFINPTDNSVSAQLLSSNFDVVNAYFNTQRTQQLTATGKPVDQFHFTVPTGQFSASATLSAPGPLSFGFELALLQAAPPRKIVVAYTLSDFNPADPSQINTNNNPAIANRIVRGTEIVSVNRVNVAQGTDINTLIELFQPLKGKRYTLEILDPGSATTRQVTLEATSLTTSPVPVYNTLANDPSVGYILFNDHNALAEYFLAVAINYLKGANQGAGIKDLILDLRYNTGGLVGIASELAYMIAGPASDGKAFANLATNGTYQAGNARFPFSGKAPGNYILPAGTPLSSLNLNTVYIITGSDTCSASEAAINGLAGIGINVVQIGATTCGKPYAFVPRDNCGTTYFAVQTKTTNNKGYGDYADGFVPLGGDTSAAPGSSNQLPGCAVADDYHNQLGGTSEARIAAAMYFRANHSCPAATPTALDNAAAQHQVLVRSPEKTIGIITPAAF